MRYVVLKFDDNDDAEAFVQLALRDPIKEYEAMGLFAGPTQFCTCTGGRGRIHSWTRGQRFGWWVCKSCKKPSEATGGPLQQMRAVVSQSRNLLVADEEQAPATVMMEGWGAQGR